MAKLVQGYMGGFIGKLGPTVGYSWRGRWCVRTLPAHVHNPRTEAQQAHRMEFREMVRLAGRFRPAINLGLHADALERGLTECNLFVHRNHRCLSSNRLDYSALQVSRGPVAPVGFGGWTVDSQGVLRVEYDKNPLARRANGDDEVLLFIYCADLQYGMKLQSSRRADRRIAVALPDEWVGRELHLYGFVRDRQGRVSNSVYIPQAVAVETPPPIPSDILSITQTHFVQTADTDFPIAEGKKAEGIPPRTPS